MDPRPFVTFPQVDPRIPHHAPMLGATPLPAVPQGGEVDASGTTSGFADPLPEVLLGLATSGLSGALTGGVAAGSWRGAGIGAAATATVWSVLTLLGSWRHTGLGSRIALGLAVVLGGATSAGLILTRRKGE